MTTTIITTIMPDVAGKKNASAIDWVGAGGSGAAGGASVIVNAVSEVDA